MDENGYERALDAAARLDLPVLARLVEELSRLVAQRREQAASVPGGGRHPGGAVDLCSSSPGTPVADADPVWRWAACAALAAQGLARRQIAGALGLSTGEVAGSLKLHRLVPEPVKAALSAGRLPERAVQRLATLRLPWNDEHPLAVWLSSRKARQSLMEMVVRAGWSDTVDYAYPLRLAAAYYEQLAGPPWQQRFVEELKARVLDVAGDGVMHAYQSVECLRSPFRVSVDSRGGREVYTVIDARVGLPVGPARGDVHHARAEAERRNREVVLEVEGEGDRFFMCTIALEGTDRSPLLPE